MNKDILLLGPLTNKREASLTGGAIVLFENLLTELNQLEHKYIIIDTNKKNYGNVFFAYLSILFQLFIKQYSVNHISLHSSRDYIFLAPFMIIIGKLFRKKTSLRKFGGEAWKTYSSSKGIRRYLLKFIFSNINFVFLEMKFLANNFKNLNKNTYWFPNVRTKAVYQPKHKIYSKKFAFISHVKKSKGVDEIIEVIKLLDSSYTIDIYGVISDTRYSEAFFKKENISYKGALVAEEVLPTLARYDVLLLPTTWKSEGYPGIIIEGYSMGKPTIATNLQGISEIIDDYKSGILIEPHNVIELKNAIEYFNKANYEEMSHLAKEKFTLFNSTKQTKLFLDVVLRIDR